MRADLAGLCLDGELASCPHQEYPARVSPAVEVEETLLLETTSSPDLEAADAAATLPLERTAALDAQASIPAATSNGYVWSTAAQDSRSDSRAPSPTSNRGTSPRSRSSRVSTVIAHAGSARSAPETPGTTNHQQEQALLLLGHDDSSPPSPLALHVRSAESASMLASYATNLSPGSEFPRWCFSRDGEIAEGTPTADDEGGGGSGGGDDDSHLTMLLSRLRLYFAQQQSEARPRWESPGDEMALETRHGMMTTFWPGEGTEEEDEPAMGEERRPQEPPA